MRKPETSSASGWARLAPWLGLVLIGLYWWSVHPLGFSLGYLEDYCPDILRQLTAENLDQFGKPVFHSKAFLAPTGGPLPYMSWSIERDWLGAYFWKMNPEFPYLWFYFGMSLLITYGGVGFILRKMSLSRAGAWLLATAIVLFHIPRHFKIWHHFEHLPQHWIYLSLFLDAWIWQRVWKEKQWSIQLEAWRGFFALGVFLSTGYFWGAMVLEWLIVRACILGLICVRRKSKERIRVVFDLKKLLVPICLGLGIFAIELRWFLELYEESKSVGKVFNSLGWFSNFKRPFLPLWSDLIFQPSQPFYEKTETNTSLGWFLWIPFFIAVSSLTKKRKGPGLLAALPFLIYFGIAFCWQSEIFPHPVIRTLQSVIPLLEFFRVASRWSLVLPAVLGTVLALAWPNLSQIVTRAIKNRVTARVALGLFLMSSLAEGYWLTYPVKMVAPMPEPAKDLLSEVRQMPGTTVLNMPFCNAGGNGYCTAQQCPNYPYSVVSQCLRLWHDKNVFGVYQARTTPVHCQIYQSPPYLSWFSAWGQQRCFNEDEWKQLCTYLDEHTEVTSILLHPDIWVGAGTPECLAQFESHFGAPLKEAVLPLVPSRGGHWEGRSRILLYSAQCRAPSVPVAGH